MPEKDPNLWQGIYSALAQSAIWQGAILATIIAALRVLYDNNSIRPIRVIIEALLCGALSLCVSGIVEIVGLPSSFVITIGGAIGFLGVTTLRDYILRMINKKMQDIEGKKD